MSRDSLLRVSKPSSLSHARAICGSSPLPSFLLPTFSNPPTCATQKPIGRKQPCCSSRVSSKFRRHGLVMQFLGEDVFVTARWDRFEGTRIHAEDLLQALGDPISDKYGVYDDVYRLLSPHGLERDYLRQMLFNVAIGNADAHAKNYSFLLAGSDVRLAPLYDTLPIFLWPQYDQKLCISINGKWTLDGVTEADWVAWAGAAGYDPELVVTEMRTIFSVVGERLPEVLSTDGISNEGVRRARAYSQLVKASLRSG